MKGLIKKLRPYFPFFLALIGGLALPYAFAPYYAGVAAIASCTLYIASLNRVSPKKAFLVGWIYGLASFGFGTHWIYYSIHDFGNAPPWLAGVITSVFVMVLALFPAFLAAILNKFFKSNNLVRCLLAFPAFWVVFEILRGWFLTGFPWLYIGYTQMSNHLRQFAPIGSVWAVSWATVFVSGVLYAFINYFYENEDNKKKRNILIISMVAIWSLAFAANRITWIYPSENKVDIALVQGNIAQLMRWDENAINSILQTYETLTNEIINDTSLIIWPEAAVPVPIPQALPFLQKWEEIAKQNQVGIILGIPTKVEGKDSYYNSLMGIGLASGTYHKTRLVPFGEYVPFESMLRGLIGFFDLPMSSFIPGAENQGVLNAIGYKFAPAICYEIAYPWYVQTIAKNADFILTVSNDAWFGKSIGPAQHLQIAQLRALEMGRPVIRSTNTGFTAFINDQGQVQEIAPQFEPQVLKGVVTVNVGQTPWAKWGPWPLFGALATVIGLAFFLRWRIKY